MDESLIKQLSMSQQRDQFAENAKVLAWMLRTYYNDLREVGFSALEALSITTSYQAHVIAQANQQQKGEQ